MKRLVIAAALAATTLSGIAAAQTASQAGAPNDPAPNRTHRAMALDLNKDGVITRAEAIAAADARFAKLDADRDGKVSAGERRNKRGNAADMTREQLRDRALARFDRADANKDGKIDQTERQALRGKHGKRHGMRQGARHHGAGMGALAMADANRDGTVTKAEAVAAAGAMFDRVDTNRDGRIDQAEREAMRGAMKQRRGGNAR